MAASSDRPDRKPPAATITHERGEYDADEPSSAPVHDALLPATSEERAIVVRAARAYRDEHGELPQWWVRRAVETIGGSERHFRRLVGRDYPGRQAWRPADEHWHTLFAAKGNWTRSHQLCKEAGYPVPTSARHYSRQMQRHGDQSMIAAAKKGYSGLRSTRASNRRPITRKGEQYAIDHSPSNVLVRPVDGDAFDEPYHPWETTTIDEATRLELEVVVSATQPDTAVVVAALALAVEGWATEDGVYIGGTPESVVSDNGGELRTSPVVAGLVRIGVSRRFSGVRESQQNGSVERKQQTSQRAHQSLLPGYIDPDLPIYERKRLEQEWKYRPQELLTFRQYALLRRREQVRYNFETVHSSLKGKTPFQAWCDDPTPLPPGDPKAVRLAMLKSETRVVDHGTVRAFDERFYPEDDPFHKQAKPLDYFDGQIVEIRWMPGGVPDFLFVFHDGEFVTKCRGEHVGGGTNQSSLRSNRDDCNLQFLTYAAEGEKLIAERTRSLLHDAQAEFRPAQELVDGVGVDGEALPALPPDGHSAWADRVPGNAGRGPRKKTTRKKTAPQAPARDAKREAMYRDYIARERENARF